MDFEQNIAGIAGGYLHKVFAASCVYVRRKPVFLSAAQLGMSAQNYGFFIPQIAPQIPPKDKKEAKLYFEPFYDLVAQQKDAQALQQTLMTQQQEIFGKFQQEQLAMMNNMISGFNATLQSMSETMGKMVDNFDQLPETQEFGFSKPAESLAVNTPHNQRQSVAVNNDNGNTIRVMPHPISKRLEREKAG